MSNIFGFVPALLLSAHCPLLKWERPPPQKLLKFVIDPSLICPAHVSPRCLQLQRGQNFPTSKTEAHIVCGEVLRCRVCEKELSSLHLFCPTMASTIDLVSVGHEQAVVPSYRSRVVLLGMDLCYISNVHVQFVKKIILSFN